MKCRNWPRRLNETLGDDTKEGQLSHLVDTTDRAMRQFETTLAAFNEILGDAPTSGVPTNVARPPLNGRPPLNQQTPLNQPSPLNQPAPLNQQVPLNQPAPLDQPVPLNQQPPSTQPPSSGQEMRRNLREGLNELPEAVREMRATMNEFRIVLQSAEKNFKNLEGFTEPLGQKGTDITSALLKAVNGIDRMATDFNSVTQVLSNRRGTIGQLLYDPQGVRQLQHLDDECQHGAGRYS